MEIKTALIETTFLPSSTRHGYGNGYVGVPPGHPWFNQDYDLINPNISVHGGLTYSNNHVPGLESDGFWWVGFDTCHFSDNAIECDKTYCENEIQNLKKQAENA